VEYLLEKLRLPEPVGEAQISLWDKNIDQGQEISPCTQIIWGRKRGDTLELHVHTHSSDAYKKLLMNLQEFISLHQYLAGRLDLNPGRYIHFLDSCHIHRQDKDAALALLKEFDKACTAS
ncbi:MAG: thymidylate synthase, partial [Candidatus Obscuribacterales bacterium]|nr:thymidylate synthase [Candidatus Obscuribacterales bacterium]